MLDTIFMHVLDMSKTASIAILAILLVRLVLKTAPKIFSYALWAVVLFRLLCPFSFEAPVSVVPEMPSVSEDYTLTEEPISVLGASEAAYQAVGDALNGGLGTQHIQTTEKDAAGMTRYVTADWRSVWILFGQYVWAAGAVSMLVYSAASCLNIRRKLLVAVPLRDNILIADDIQSPFVIGLLRPRIYLPCNLGSKEQEYIILHEQHHIKRFDHVIKVLAFLALTVHWFNPLVWLAFLLAGKDMEMSCDEAVMGKMSYDVRADYSASLLAFATGRRIITGTPLAFGGGDPKGRIRNLARWKKPAVRVVAGAFIVCITVAVCLVANPKERVRELMKSGTSWVCDEHQLSFTVGEGGVIEGTFAHLEDSTISVGYRFAGRYKAVFDIYQGDWEQAQSSGEAPLLAGILEAENGTLILEVEKDNIGLDTDRIVFRKTTTRSTEYQIAGKSYTYEKEGFFGNFTVTLNTDGTFTYYEGSASSYIGRGSWTREGDMVTLADEDFPFVNRFLIAGDDLVFIGTGSTNFLYIKVKDGEKFFSSGTDGTDDSVPGSVIACTDLDHDGTDEEIMVRETEPGWLYELTVMENGTVLWSKDLSTAHAGWGTIMLYTEGGRDYLVEYTPYMNTGIGSYTCTIFSPENGEQTVMQEWSVEFKHLSPETAEMKQFAEEVGILLRNCAVLLSTEQGVLVDCWTDASELPQIYPVRFNPTETKAAMEGITLPRELTSNAAEFPDTPLKLLFASGAGAWGTDLTLQPDGSFTGSYSDADMGDFSTEYPSGTCYVCKFSGRFTDIRQINDHTWLMKLSELTTQQQPGEIWIADQIQYIASEAYGLSGGNEFLLYAPGTPADEMYAQARKWWPDAWRWRNGEIDLLDGWGLCNVSLGAGFFTP